MAAKGVVDARATKLLSQVYFGASHSIRHADFCDRLALIGREAGWACTREADSLLWCGVGMAVAARVEAAETAYARGKRALGCRDGSAGCGDVGGLVVHAEAQLPGSKWGPPAAVACCFAAWLPPATPADWSHRYDTMQNIF